MRFTNIAKLPIAVSAVAVAVLASFVVGTPDAHAGDWKTLPGATCRAWGVDEDWDSRYAYTYEGWVLNPLLIVSEDQQTVQFVCPVVGDCVGNLSTGHWVSIRDDHVHDTVAVRCRIEVRTGTGSYYIGAWTNSTGASITPVVYSMTSPTDTPSYVYKMLFCQVPGYQSGRQWNGVVAYAVEENC